MLAACVQHKADPLPGQDLIEDALRADLDKTLMNIAEQDADFRGRDLYYSEIHLKAKRIYDAAKLNYGLINELDSTLSKQETQKQCEVFLNNMQHIVLDNINPDQQSKYPLLPKASENRFENRIILLAYTTQALRVFNGQIMPFCGIVEFNELKTIAEKTQINKGETFKCMNIFEKDPKNAQKELPLKLEPNRYLKTGMWNTHLLKLAIIRCIFLNHLYAFPVKKKPTSMKFLSQFFRKFQYFLKIVLTSWISRADDFQKAL